MIAILNKTSTRHIPQLSEPQFTGIQETAMSRLFPRLSKDIQHSWNKIPSKDKLWARCFHFLIQDYARYIALESRVNTAPQDALAFLIQRKKEGNLKDFFCQHVLTTTEQIKERISLFIRRTRLNQDGQYACFIPSMRSSSIACYIIAENQLLPRKSDDSCYFNLSKALKGRVEVIREVDFLLDSSLDEKDMPQQKLLTRHRFIKKNVRMICQPAVVLPPSQNAMKEAIAKSIPGPFQKKVQEIGRIQEAKRRVFLIMLCTTVVVSAFAIWMVYSKKL